MQPNWGKTGDMSRCRTIDFQNAGSTLDHSKNIILQNPDNELATCDIQVANWVKNQYETCGEQGDCVKTGKEAQGWIDLGPCQNLQVQKPYMDPPKPFRTFWHIARQSISRPSCALFHSLLSFFSSPLLVWSFHSFSPSFLLTSFPLFFRPRNWKRTRRSTSNWNGIWLWFNYDESYRGRPFHVI